MRMIKGLNLQKKSSKKSMLRENNQMFFSIKPAVGNMECTFIVSYFQSLYS